MKDDRKVMAKNWLLYVPVKKHINHPILPCKMMCFSSCRLLFEHLNVEVNGWGWATMSYFWIV